MFHLRSPKLACLSDTGLSNATYLENTLVKLRFLQQRRKAKIGLATLLVVAAILVAGRIYLPTLLKNYVNRVLDRMPDYRGHVDDISVALYRGAYRIYGISLLKRNGKVTEPFLAIKAADLSVEWRALIKASLAGEVELEHPVLNIINSDTSEAQQTAMKKDWADVVKDLFPFRINRFAVTDGKVTYRHNGPGDAISLVITDLNGNITNLSNARYAKEAMPSHLDAKGKLQKQFPVTLTARLNPLVRPPVFEGNLSITKVDITQLNELLIRLVDADAEEGTVSVYSQALSTGGAFNGYLKIIAKNVSVLSLKKDIENPLHLIWQALVAAVVEIFTNQRHDQFATEIPFSGRYEDPQPDIFSAIVAIVKNAFLKAIPAGFDKSLTPVEAKAK